MTLPAPQNPDTFTLGGPEPIHLLTQSESLKEHSESSKGKQDHPSSNPVSIAESLVSYDFLVPAFALLNIGLFYLIQSITPFLEFRESSSMISLLNTFCWIISAGLLAYAAARSIPQTIEDALRRRMGAPALLTLSIGSLFVGTVLGTFAASNPGGIVPGPDEFSIIVSCLLLLNFAEAYVTSRGGFSREEDPFSMPSTLLAKDGERIESSKLRPGDVLVLQPGDIVPCDGIVTKGDSQVEERRLSGLRSTKLKGIDDAVFAGSKIISGPLEVRVTASREESFITSFSDLFTRNTSFLDETKKGDELFSTFYALGVLFASILGAVFWFARGEGGALSFSVFGAMTLLGLVPLALRIEVFVMKRALCMSFLRGIMGKTLPNSLEELSKIQTLAIDYAPQEAPGQTQIKEFHIIDERVDRDALISVLMALFSRSEGEFQFAVTEFLRPLVPSPQVYKVADYREYGSKGMSGVVERVEFTVGTEELLIERGVQLQASELEGEEGESLFVAMEDEVVSKFVLLPPFSRDGSKLVSEMRDIGVRTVLMSEASGETVDATAKSIGLELPDSFGSIQGEQFESKLESLKPAALFVRAGTEAARMKAANLSIGVFDEFRWDVERTDITLFSSDLSLLPWLFSTAKRIASVHRQNLYFSAAITLVTGILAASALLSPLVASLTVLLAGLFILGNSLRAVR